MEFPELFEKIVKDFLDRAKKERKENVFYPSELPYCIRRNYFLYKNPKEIDLETKKIFESGSIVHSWVRDVLFKGFTEMALKDFKWEESLIFKGNDFEIHGRYDDLVAVELHEKPILLEIKTVRSLKYIKEPKRHHVMQLNFYLTVLKLETGYIVYIDRTNLQHKIFKLTKDKRLFDEMLKRAEMLRRALKEKKIPIAEARLDVTKRWQCRYCPYRLECLETGEE